MRLGAYPGSLQIETPFVIPDTTRASFRDDKVFPQDRVATDSDFAHSALIRKWSASELPLNNRYRVLPIANYKFL